MRSLYQSLDLSHLWAMFISLTGLTVVLSAAGCVIAFQQNGGGNLRAFVKYCLPRELISKRSCYLDVGFVLLKQLIRPWTSVPVLLLTSAHCAIATYMILTYALGPRAQLPMSVWLFCLLLSAALLIQDFLRFGSHYLLHRLSALWDVHKVHHSADYLTPVTNHRVHIVEELLEQAATGLSVGPLLGLASWITSSAIATTDLLGVDAYMLIDTLCFAWLRHSHIGLSFGRAERFIMSPRQHHLHHSVDERHWNKNFGFLLACWDQMAGTIAYSNPREPISFGIAASERADYDSVIKLHCMPYIKWFRRCCVWHSERRDRKRDCRTLTGAVGQTGDFVATLPDDLRNRAT